VREGDPDAAERAMREHMEVTRVRLEETQGREHGAARSHLRPPKGGEKRRRVER